MDAHVQNCQAALDTDAEVEVMKGAKKPKPHMLAPIKEALGKAHSDYVAREQKAGGKPFNKTALMDAIEEPLDTFGQLNRAEPSRYLPRDKAEKLAGILGFEVSALFYPSKEEVEQAEARKAAMEARVSKIWPKYEALSADLEKARAAVLEELHAYRLPMAEPDQYGDLLRDMTTRGVRVEPLKIREEEFGLEHVPAVTETVRMLAGAVGIINDPTGPGAFGLGMHLRDHVLKVLKPLGIVLLVGRYVERRVQYEDWDEVPGDNIEPVRVLVLRICSADMAARIAAEGLSWSRGGEASEETYVERYPEHYGRTLAELEAWNGGPIGPNLSVVEAAARAVDTFIQANRTTAEG